VRVVDRIEGIDRSGTEADELITHILAVVNERGQCTRVADNNLAVARKAWRSVGARQRLTRIVGCGRGNDYVCAFSDYRASGVGEIRGVRLDNCTCSGDACLRQPVVSM
jgi:hypothetical protein